MSRSAQANARADMNRRPSRQYQLLSIIAAVCLPPAMAPWAGTVFNFAFVIAAATGPYLTNRLFAEDQRTGDALPWTRIR